jgi:type II secretory pathway predicted ATPase ExeA
MYEQFYGLSRRPFSLTPDPDFLYLSKQHAVTLAMLEYGLGNQAGFTLITGEIGSGKTTLIRHILKNMGREVTVGVITNTHRNFGDLLTWILSAYGLERGSHDKVMMYQQLVDFVASEFLQERRVVLIVDEAQNMDVETLEELRLLSNMNIGDELLLQLIIVGQPELQQTLLRPELTQFAQRISVEHHITALDLSDTGKYIDHRLRVAGGVTGIFDRYAVAAVYYFSRGTPRAINNICDMTMVYGFAEEQNPITCELVIEVVKTRRIIREQAARLPRDPGDERLRQMLVEIKGIDMESID